VEGKEKMKTRTTGKYRILFTVFMVLVFLFPSLGISGSKVYAQAIPTDTLTLEPQPTEGPTLEPTDTGTATVVPTDTETATLVPTDTETSTLVPTDTETAPLVPTGTETAMVVPTDTETSTLVPTVTETSTLVSTVTETSTLVSTETAVPAFSWELTLDYSNSSDANGSKAAAASQKLNKLAVTSKSENLGNGNYQLMLSGGGDVELIRLVIYEILLPDFNFLDGSAIISIQTTTTSGSPITVNLESQPGTGYTWGLNAPKTSTFTMQGTPTTTNRFDGPDTTALETMALQPSVTGPSTLELVYQRPFEKSEAVTRHLTITLPGSVSSIDLSDPNPPVEASTNSTVGEFSAQNNLVQPETSTAGLPQSFDWRATNKVSDIRDQGSCGSCWAFGLTSVMESALRIDQNITADLSEQFLVSCNIPAKNTQCGQNKYNCEYGGCEDAQQYDVNTSGLNQSVAGAVLESQFPYTASDSACPANLTHAYQAASWNYVGGIWSPTVDQIKNAIYTYGPVTSRVCVGSAFDDYTGGEFTTDEGTCENHTIVLVGWDDNGWILRNSWGTGWGESGYMHIGWNVSGVGNGVTYVTMPVIPGTPTSLSPSGTTYVFKPTYQWNPVTSATGYVLKVTDTDTNVVVVNATVSSSACNGTVCSNTPSTGLADGNYQFVVAAKNSNGQSGFSDPMTFYEAYHTPPLSVPTLLAPSGTIYVLKPTYQWNPSGGSAATGYVLKVTNTDTNVDVVTVNVPTSACKNGVCSNTPSIGLTDGNYQFEVAAKNSFGQSDFSIPVTFSDAYHTHPFTPTLLAPSGQIYVLKPTYQWDVAGGSAATGYVLKVTNTDTNVDVVNVNVSTGACKNGVCSNTPSIGLADGNYQFEVAAKNSFGQSDFSTPVTFNDAYHTQPFTPTLLAPSGQIYVLKPTYQWNVAGGSVPTGYVLKVTNTDTNVVVVNATVSSSACKNGVCSSTPSIGLADGNYQFEVAAKNSFGQSAFSTPVTFTDAYHTPPAAPTLLSPSGTINLDEPTYQWNPSGGSAPTGYVLKVTNTDTNVIFVNNVSVSTSACKNGVCSYTPAVSLTNGNYKLEVAGKNTFGQGAFSTPMTFTVFGFNSQFNGNARDWVPQAGGSWKTTSSYYYTNGYSGGGWSTSLFNATYTDFDYAARLKRVGGVYYDSTDSSYWAPANTLFVRTSGNAGYEFDYYDFGSVNYSSYSIWKNYSDGSWVNVTDASTTAVVNNNWNTLRVTASGDTLNFYINDQLVYTYTDSDFGSGAIGVGMSKITTASTTFEVDWATLGYYGSGSVALPQTIGAEQQALNAAGMNIPADQITRGKMKYIQSQ
jgi:C1A family cysteine protease